MARLEVKHITRAFMQVENCLKRKKPPLAPLLPWEAIPVNTAKIRRYAKIYDEEGIPIHLVWRVDRACLPGKFFYQDIQTLIGIVNRYGEKREFVGAGEDGDKTAFHYSVNELMPFDIDTYLDFLFPSRQATSPNTLLANADYDYPEYEYTDADAPPENL